MPVYPEYMAEQQAAGLGPNTTVAKTLTELKERRAVDEDVSLFYT